MKTDTEYTEFITGLRDVVYRLVLNILDNSSEAEDIVQDVFERTWRARDKVLENAYPRAYVCRMAHNLAIDRVRAITRRQTFQIDSKTTTNDGNKHIEEKDIASITRHIIASLPEKQQLAIHLRDVEGYEIEEIAEAIGSDESNVRMNLSRARKTVREQLLKAMNYGVK